VDVRGCRCGVMYEDNAMLRERVDGRDKGKRGVAKETVQYLCSSGERGRGVNHLSFAVRTEMAGVI